MLYIDVQMDRSTARNTKNLCSHYKKFMTKYHHLINPQAYMVYSSTAVYRGMEMSMDNPVTCLFSL